MRDFCLFFGVVFSVWLFFESLSFVLTRFVGQRDIEVAVLPYEVSSEAVATAKFFENLLSQYCKPVNGFFKVDKLSLSWDGYFYRIECNGTVLGINKDLVSIVVKRGKEEN